MIEVKEIDLLTATSYLKEKGFDDIKELNRRTREIMTMHKALHPKMQTVRSG